MNCVSCRNGSGRKCRHEAACEVASTMEEGMGDESSDGGEDAAESVHQGTVQSANASFIVDGSTEPTTDVDGDFMDVENDVSSTEVPASSGRGNKITGVCSKLRGGPYRCTKKSRSFYPKGWRRALFMCWSEKKKSRATRGYHIDGESWERGNYVWGRGRQSMRRHYPWTKRK